MRPWRADTTPRRRRRKLESLMGLRLIVAVVLAALCVDPAAAAGCPNASTLFRGATESDAIAYRDDCTPRIFRVVDDASGPNVVSLNLSHLNLVRVADYPPVNKLLLHDNFLTTFQTPTTESLMEELDLHNNRIANLSSLRLPRRLSRLDLSNNKIESLNATVPWPAAFELKWLSLDSNQLHVIAADAFEPLTTLTYLSLANTTLENLGDLTFPLSLSTLNLSRNLFVAEKLKFAEVPVALQSLDLSGNKLSRFPDLSAFSSLVDLNLANNAMKSMAGVRLPPKLKKLNLSANQLENIVIAQSDLKILQNLDELTVSATALSTTCKSDKAARQPVRDGLTVCVLSDELLKSETATIGTDTPSKPTSSSPSASRKPGSLTDSGSSSNDASSSSGSRMSNKSMILIGGGCFAMGLIVAAYVFLVRRDRRVIRGKSSGLPTFAPDASDASSRTFGRYFRETGDYTNASWVVGSPVKGQRRQQNGVAILEDDSSRRGRGRSKVDDLLVYEIPLDEIQIKEVLAHKPRNDEALHMAEYQGFQVVMHTLLDGRNKLQRGRRRVERDFVEQVRLASMLEHVCIVQFIGITLGSQRQSMHQKQKWKMGAVFEYMHCGSLASIFHEERMRREGRQFNGSSAARTTSIKSESGFSWYPSLQASIVETSSLSPTAQRSKLALALDVAMALSYLHAMGYAHGDLRAEKVLVNEQGEAKLSGMDISLAVNVPELTPTRGDVRASAVKARLKVKSMFQSSISHSPALGNSLLNSGAAVNGGIAPVAMSSMTTSAVLISANSRAWRRGMQGDIYAFGLLLWELDTMMCVGAMKRLTAAATEIGEEHQLLRFSPECPVEIQNLARRCWHPELKSRPTALDLQEEIVRLLEGRLTTLSDRSRGTHRWSRRTNSRNGGSWSFASSHSSLSHSDYRSSSLVISETEV